jgi:hypothetical protein
MTFFYRLEMSVIVRFVNRVAILLKACITLHPDYVNDGLKVSERAEIAENLKVSGS